MNNLIEFERQVNQDLFRYILGEFYNDLDGANYENDTFIIRHYDWDGDDGRPNFEHKPSGFKLWWYKYPLRSPEVNINISHEQFSCILYDCINSLDRIIKFEIERWWENNGK